MLVKNGNQWTSHKSAIKIPSYLLTSNKQRKLYYNLK